MAPMMLQGLAPLMEILVVAGGKGLGKGLAAAAIGFAQAFGNWAEIVGIDGQVGHGRPEREQAAHGVGGGAAVEAALCRLPAFLEPGAQGRDRRCLPFAFGLGEFVDGVEQGCGVPGRRKAAGDGAKPLGEAEKDRLGQARPDQDQKRTQSFQALARIVDALMALRRGGKRGIGRIDFGRGDAPHRLAHRHGRIKTEAQTHRTLSARRRA